VTFSGPVNGEWVSSASQTGQTLVFSQLTGNLVVVPEPSTVLIALSGVALVGFGRWRTRSNREGDQARRTGSIIPLQCIRGSCAAFAHDARTTDRDRRRV
jgi:hypothetical protein